MENKDIILIILVIIVLYLLFCDMNNKKQINELKENFTATGITTSGVTTKAIESESDKIIGSRVDAYLAKRKDIPISESIKNLGILSQKLQNAKGNFRIPANIETDSIILTNGLAEEKEIRYKIGIVGETLGISQIDNNGQIINTGSLFLNSDLIVNNDLLAKKDIKLSKDIDEKERIVTLSVDKSEITDELKEHQGTETHSLNIDTSIKFNNVSSNGLRFPIRINNPDTDDEKSITSVIYQKPEYGNLHISAGDSYINLLGKTAINDHLLIDGIKIRKTNNSGVNYLQINSNLELYSELHYRNITETGNRGIIFSYSGGLVNRGSIWSNYLVGDLEINAPNYLYLRGGDVKTIYKY